MTGLVVLVPVLRRPHRVRPLLDSIAAATPGPYRVVFICDPTDEAERAAVAAADGEALLVDGNYATKIGAGVRATAEPLLFLGADDLDFRPGWLGAAAARIAAGAQVVGVNDLIRRRPGRRGHATHFLITRAYAEQPTIDGRPGPLCDLYDHSFVDDELIATATARGVYAYCEESRVRHEHPMNDTAPDDETYRKGRARFREDRHLFEQRAGLWATR